jgi:hypothetical protein
MTPLGEISIMLSGLAGLFLVVYWPKIQSRFPWLTLGKTMHERLHAIEQEHTVHKTACEADCSAIRTTLLGVEQGVAKRIDNLACGTAVSFDEVKKAMGSLSCALSQRLDEHRMWLSDVEKGARATGESLERSWDAIRLLLLVTKRVPQYVMLQMELSLLQQRCFRLVDEASGFMDAAGDHKNSILAKLASGIRTYSRDAEWMCHRWQREPFSSIYPINEWLRDGDHTSGESLLKLLKEHAIVLQNMMTDHAARWVSDATPPKPKETTS